MQQADPSLLLNISSKIPQPSHDDRAGAQVDLACHTWELRVSSLCAWKHRCVQACLAGGGSVCQPYLNDMCVAVADL